MKKIIKIAAISLLSLCLLLVGGTILVSILYTEDIKKEIDSIIEKNINADVRYNVDNIAVSIISTFPNLEFAIEDIGVINRAPFKGDTLMHIDEFAIEVELMDLLSGHISVAGIRIENPAVNVLSKEGKSNYDIIKLSKAQKEEEPTSKDDLPKITLKHWEINNATLTYKDELTSTYIKLTNLSQQGNAKLKNSTLQTNVVSAIASMDASYNKVTYLTKHRLFSTVNLAYDLKTSSCTLQENSIKINDFSLSSKGFLKILEKNEGYKMDITLSAKNDFKSLLSIIPAIYHNQFDEVKASGSISFHAAARGIYNEESLPAFDVKLGVQNGRFQYASLPLPVEAIDADIVVSNHSGNLDNTNAAINKLQCSINQHLIKVQGDVKKLNHYQLAAEGKIDFKELEQVYPMEGINLSGTTAFNIQSAGSIKKIQKEQYGDIKTYGSLDINNMKIGVDGIPTTTIHKAQLKLKPNSLSMPIADIQVGKSDMIMKGSLSNYLGYLFKRGQVLAGNLAVTSRLIDLNEWMSSNKQGSEESKTEEDGATSLPSKLPTNIAFQLKADIAKMEMLDMPMAAMRGNISLKDGAIFFDRLTFNMLEGSFTSSGSYKTKDRELPLSSVNVAAKGISIKQAYNVFNTVKKWAPIAKHIQGETDVHFAFTSTIGKGYFPVYETMNGKGNIHIPQAGIQGFELLNKLSAMTSVKELKDPSFSNTRINFYRKIA